MTKPEVLQVYDLPAVDNVCNQTLREIPFKLPTCSVAHVTVKPGDTSLLHEHHKMFEIYFIIEGRGTIFFRDKSLRVLGGAYLFLPPGTPHKLRNTGNTDLEHLVIASPPFDPEDVHLVEDSGHEPSGPLFNYRTDSIVAPDGAIVRELLSDEEKSQANAQLALGYLLSGKIATLHRHNRSDEVYYIVAGEAYVKLGDFGTVVAKGDIIYVPVGVVHGLDNTDSDREIEVLCISSPEFQTEDFIPV